MGGGGRWRQERLQEQQWQRWVPCTACPRDSKLHCPHPHVARQDPHPGLEPQWLQTLAPHHHSQPQLLRGGHQEEVALGDPGWDGEKWEQRPLQGPGQWCGHHAHCAKDTRLLRLQRGLCTGPPRAVSQGSAPHGVTTGPDTPDPLSTPGDTPWGRAASGTRGNSRLPLSAGGTGELAVMSLDTSPGPARTWSPHCRLQGGHSWDLPLHGTRSQEQAPALPSRAQLQPPSWGCGTGPLCTLGGPGRPPPCPCRLGGAYPRCLASAHSRNLL